MTSPVPLVRGSVGDAVIDELARDLNDVAARAGVLLVRIGIVTLIVLVAIGIARLSSPLVRWMLDRRGRPSFTRVYSALVRVAIVLIGSLLALTVAFPSVRVADVLAIFGILSVAAGFAFRDTFENLLAGVLLLARDPFQSGDQVVVADRAGTVEGVTVRETLLRSPDGRRFFVPNARVMSGVIEVDTHWATRRQTVTLTVNADIDVDATRRVILAALESAAGVVDAPGPDVLVTDLVGGDLVLECRFWALSTRVEATATRDAVLTALAAALHQQDISTPVPQLEVTVANATREGPK